jgi:hypothetical protein
VVAIAIALKTSLDLFNSIGTAGAHTQKTLIDL